MNPKFSHRKLLSTISFAVLAMGMTCQAMAGCQEPGRNPDTPPAQCMERGWTNNIVVNKDKGFVDSVGEMLPALSKEAKPYVMALTKGYEKPLSDSGDLRIKVKIRPSGMSQITLSYKFD